MSEPLGVVVLGTAHTGHAWAYTRALVASPGARVLGVHDADPDHTRWIQHDLGVPVAADAASLAARAEAQVALVCSATTDHRELVELAASHGLHVLCEKPIATNLGDARAMVETCRRAGAQLHVAHPARFMPLVERARQAVRSGRIGTVLGMVGGNRGRPPVPPGYPRWITDPVAAGGGAVIDHAVHVVDAMRHLSGLEVTTVSAEVGPSSDGLAVEDVALLLLRFDSGAAGSVDPGWSVVDGNPSDYDFYLRVVGTEGSVEVDDAAALQVVSTREGGPRGVRDVGIGEDPDQAMVEAFLGSVRSGTVAESCATGEDGVASLAVALAAYRSAASGEAADVS